MAAPYAPSTKDWVREQVALYEATDGVEGGTLEGRPVVILSTVGRSSGALRKSPIIRIPYGTRYLAVASNGGSAQNPSWYYNVAASPEVRVQDGSAVLALHARELSGAEKAAAWRVADQFWPHFPDYRASVDREIPIFALEP